MIYIHNFWCNQEQKEALDREEKRAKLCSIPSGIENITSSTFKRKVVEFLNCASCRHATKRESCKEKASHQGGLFVADMSVKRALRNTLLEDLAVGKLHGLAIDERDPAGSGLACGGRCELHGRDAAGVLGVEAVA